MRRRDFALGATVLGAGAMLAACGVGGSAGEVTLLNASYDPTGDLYEHYNDHFSKKWVEADRKLRAGKARSMRVFMSHGGSGKQSRAVIDGLGADVVSLALQNDIDQIVKRTGKIPADWRSQHPNNSCPYTSTIVFLVRQGNPKGILGWDDLIRPEVSVVTPNPKTSGGARWIYLAAWAHAHSKFGGDTSRIEGFVRDLYHNVPKLDVGARGATTTFTRQGKGDVLLTWENEAYYTRKMQPRDGYGIVYPLSDPASGRKLSILAEPPVAVVEDNARRRGVLEEAQVYLRGLYADDGQRIIAEHFFRPLDPSLNSKEFEAIDMVTIDDPIFGGWAKAQPFHFAAKTGVFDRIYQPGAKST